MAQQQINIIDPGSDRLDTAFGKVNDNATDAQTRLETAEGHIGSRDGHPLATDTEPGFLSAAHHAKTERVPDIETTQRTVYVSPAGSDITGDGTSANRWATIQHAIDQARRQLVPRNGTSYYKVVLATGTYNERPTIAPNLFSSFIFEGMGAIWLTSESGVASDVVIANTNAESGINIFGSCSLEKLTIENPNRAILARGHSTVFVHVRDCVLRIPAGSASTGSAIEVHLGRAFSWNNSSPTGQLFDYGRTVHVGAVIASAGGQPTGAVANINVQSGGAIR